MEGEEDRSEARCDVAILGCGITGMTLARTLARRGLSVVVLDDYAAPGGNHLSHLAGGLEFDVGAIYFHRNDKQFDAFPELRDGCMPLRMPHCKVNRRGELVAFPFSIRGDLPGWRRALLPLSLAEAWGRRALLGAGPNVDTYVRSRIGSPLYRESGLDGYLRRFFACRPDEIDVAFATSRLGWIARQSSLRYQIARKLGRDPRRGDAHSALVRRPGGFSAYYAAAVEGLRRDGVAVRLSAGLEAIRATHGAGGTIRTRTGTVQAARIISTIPIPVAARLLGIDVPHLEHADLHSLFVAAERPLNTDSLIVYNFSDAGAWKRLTVHSAMYGGGSTAFAVEVPVPPDQAPQTDAAAFADFARHAATTRLGGGRLQLLGAARLAYAYPLFKLGYGGRRDAALARLAEAGVESVGRQGGFDYLPSSTVATLRARRYVGDG